MRRNNLKSLAALALVFGFTSSAWTMGDKGPKQPNNTNNSGNGATNPVTGKPKMNFSHWTVRPETKKLFLKELFRENVEIFSLLKAEHEKGNTKATVEDVRKSYEANRSSGNYNPYDPARIDIKMLNAAWVSTMGSFMNDAPASVGRYNMGYYQPIWDSISKVALEKVVPITPDGVVLTPNRDDMALAIIRNRDTKITPSGVNVGVRLFLINERRYLMDQQLIPVNFRAKVDVDGNPKPDSGLSREMLEAARLIEEYEKGVIALAYDPSETFKNILASDNPALHLFDCFRSVAARPVDDVGACFKKAGQDFLAGGQTVLKAIGAGFWQGLPFTQKTANGFSTIPLLDSFLNMFNVAYNSYLRKEDISSGDIKEMAAFLAGQSVTQNQFGEIIPGEIGEWAYYPEQKVVRKVAKDADGSYILVGSDGNPLEARLILQFQETDDSVILPRP